MTARLMKTMIDCVVKTHTHKSQYFVWCSALLYF